MSPRLVFALETARSAGVLILKHFQTQVEIDRKGDETPVTVADRSAEQFIRGEIERHYPEDSVLGEEFGLSGDSDSRWIIDPIDGTKSFVCGVPLFGTLIAYVENGEPLIGVAHFPALNEVVFAERGSGCYWNNKRCSVTTNSDLVYATLCCGGHSSMAKKGRMAGLIDLAQRCQATRTWCDAYGHILVATGRVDAMIDPVVAEWDIAALRPILTEAGGKMTDFSGVEPSNEAISSNGLLHATVLEAFSP